MEHARRIVRRGREGDRVGHVAVVVVDIAQHRPAVDMAHDVHVAADFMDVTALFDDKAVDLVSDLIFHITLPTFLRSARSRF